MKSAPESLPNDVLALKALVLEHANQVTQLEIENQRHQARIHCLEEQLNILRAQRFDKSSEKSAPGQMDLFNKAEVTQCDAAEREAPLEETVAVPEHTRKKTGRKPLPPDLPRVDLIHDLPECEKTCVHDGTGLVEIGEAVCEQLDIIPAQVRVLRHIRKKYACPCCEMGVKTAPLPAQPIPKSLASAGLLAQVAVSKYQDALPLYRQEQILKRIGIALPRATLARWMIQIGDRVQPLINLLHETLLSENLIQMDETTVQVLKETGKTAPSKSYMWVQKGGPPKAPMVLYHYRDSRNQQNPLQLLDGFQGYLQTDGYEGYTAVGTQPGVIQVGCFAHARRKFDEAVKAQGKKGKPKAGKATKGLAFIQKLYRIEMTLKQASVEMRFQTRQTQAVPLLAEMRTWLDQSIQSVPPQSAIGKALHYLNNQWPKLIRYCDDGRLNIDNNAVERAIRPFVTGRKNWLFSDTVKGAKASANLYSLIETAKANNLEPYHYLRHLFKELPAAQTLEDLEQLLPTNLDADRINRMDPLTEACR